MSMPATFNLDPASLKRAVATAKRHGLKPKAVIPVDLFGLPADHDAIAGDRQGRRPVRARRRRAGFGATYKGRKLGTLAPATATSFFPAKPLGCYGDGGAVLTDDAGSGRHAQEPARARAGRRQVRQRADRHDQPPRHHPGRGADREAEDFRRRDRRARPGGARATPRACRMSRSCRRCPTASPRSGRNTPSASSPACATGSPPR